MKRKIIFRWPIKIVKYNPDRDPRRNFTHTQQVQIWTEQNGVCPDCGKPLDLRTVIYHHIKPWHEGGKTIISNGVALDPTCHAIRTFSHNAQDAEKSRGGNI